MSFFKLIYKNISNIIEYVEKNNKNGIIKYNFNKENCIDIDLLGEGTYGIVYKITNNTKYIKEIKKNESIILKIIKIKCEEYKKCKNLKKKMDSLKNNKIKNILINNYCTKILYLKKINNIELIFFDYNNGIELKNYIINNKLTIEELNIIYLKCLLSIKVFHKILNYSHRDIKLKNFIYDKNNDLIKIIDYGFICDRKDIPCYNKYQGTAHYIHPYMNKKYSKAYLSKKNNNNKNNNKNNSFTSNIKSKKVFKNPNSISQDLFSSLIIFIKILHIYYEKNNIKNDLQKYIKDFNKTGERSHRYINKKKFINNLIKINKDFNNPVINLIIGVFKNFWDLKKMNFYINNIENENISEYIYDSLIYSLILLTNKFNKKDYLMNEWRNIIKLK